MVWGIFCDISCVRCLVLPRVPPAENNEHCANDADDDQPADHTADDRADLVSRSRTRVPILVSILVPIDWTRGDGLVRDTIRG